MSGSSAVIPLAAAAGGLLAVAGREAVIATPALARWVRRALDPLGRAGSEGYMPTALERRRLAIVGAVALPLLGVLVLGSAGAAFLALAGPAAAAVTVRRRRERYLREVDGGLGGLALSIADALAAGRSLRAALVEAGAGPDGPAAAELARVRADLDLGLPTGAALAGLRERVGSARVDSFCAALLSQQVAGGDLAGLLRRFAATSAQRDRAMADARSATAQARFTGMLVAAMPAGAAVFAELLEPGFVAAMLAQPAPAVLLALAAGLQAGGFVAISRLSRVEDP
jgi:tight adherence protein B